MIRPWRSPIAFALKKHRKFLQRLQSSDDQAHHQAALRIVAELRLSGIETSRRPQDLSFSHLCRGPGGG